MAPRSRCRATAVVTNFGSGTVSTIDVKTGTKHSTDITVGSLPAGVAVTPDGKTVFVGHRESGTVSTIDVKTRTKNPTDITVSSNPDFILSGLAVTPDGKTVFVANIGGGARLGRRFRVDDRCADQDEEPHGHHRRLPPIRGGGDAKRQDRFRHQQRQRHGVDD
jgi:YVTN family beta-propeller protein